MCSETELIDQSNVVSDIVTTPYVFSGDLLPNNDGADFPDTDLFQNTTIEIRFLVNAVQNINTIEFLNKFTLSRRPLMSLGVARTWIRLVNKWTTHNCACLVKFPALYQLLGCARNATNRLQIRLVNVFKNWMQWRLQRVMWNVYMMRVIVTGVVIVSVYVG